LSYGQFHVEEPADPGVAAAYPLLTVPANEIWIPDTCRLILATDANVNDRHLRIEFIDPVAAVTFFSWQSFFSQVANRAYGWHGCAANIGTSSGTWSSVPLVNFQLPAIVLLPGQQFRVSVDGVQAGDTLTAAYWRFRKFKELA